MRCVTLWLQLPSPSGEGREARPFASGVRGFGRNQIDADSHRFLRRIQNCILMNFALRSVDNQFAFFKFSPSQGAAMSHRLAVLACLLFCSTLFAADTIKFKDSASSKIMKPPKGAPIP